MNIYSAPGTKVIFNGDVTKAQIKWGSHTDPLEILKPWEEYIIDRIEIHSFHTKVFLREFPDKPFNSLWFDHK